MICKKRKNTKGSSKGGRIEISAPFSIYPLHSRRTLGSCSFVLYIVKYLLKSAARRTGTRKVAEIIGNKKVCAIPKKGGAYFYPAAGSAEKGERRGRRAGSASKRIGGREGILWQVSPPERLPKTSPNSRRGRRRPGRTSCTRG